MATPPPADRSELLLTHLDSLYRLARAVTTDGAQAIHLVEDTYAQALTTIPLGHTDADNRRWLLGLLFQVHAERQALATSEPAAPATPGADAPPASLEVPAAVSAAERPGPLAELRRRIAEELAARAMPIVFAGLPEPDRLLLCLCDVEELSCTDAGQVLGLEAGQACAQLAAARTTLRAALQAEASPGERALLPYLTEGALADTLRDAAETAYGQAPSSLRPAVRQATAAPPLPPEPPRVMVPAMPEQAPATRPRAAAFGPPLRRLVLTLLLVVTVAAMGYLASQALKRPPETNLITLAVEQADAVQPALPTSNPAQAEAFVEGRLGWRLTLPSIDQATLAGASTVEMTPGVTVPVFRYEDTLDADAPEPITLYVFSYVLLDRYEDRIQLEPGILRQIQEEQRFDLHDLGTRQVLIWRNQDDIYVAVTTGSAEALRQRIVLPS